MALVIRNPALWPVGVLVLVGVVFSFTMPQNFTEAEDALHYAFRVASGEPQWHPNHLLYEPFNALVFSAIQSLGVDAAARDVMQVVSLTAGIATLAVIYVIARRASACPALAALAVLSTAFSFAFWVYVMMPDTYALPLLPYMMSIMVTQSINQSLSEGRPVASGQLVLLGTLSAFATLLHQQHVFLVLGVFLSFTILRSLKITSESLIRLAAVFVFTFLSIVGGAYLGVGIAVIGAESPAELSAWAMGHARGGMWTPWSWASPFRSLVGLGTAIWSPAIVFADAGWADTMARAFPHKHFVEEMFLVESGFLERAWIVVALIAIGSLCMLALFATVFLRTSSRARIERKQEMLSSRDVTVVTLLPVALAYAAAITVWEPTNREFWIAVLPMFFLLLISLQPPRQRTTALAAGAAFSLFAGNLFGAVGPYSSQESDYWKTTNRFVFEEVADTDILLTKCAYICKGYLDYYLKGKAIDVRNTAKVGAMLKNPPSGRIFISSWAFDEKLMSLKKERQARAEQTRGLPLILGGKTVKGRLTAVHMAFDQQIYVLAPE